MGVSFSRSVKFGPLRVNFSTRGVGLSAGVRGARVSIGPRGTYISLGVSGFRYRAKLGGSPSAGSPGAFQAPTDVSPLGAPSYDPGRIHTATVAELADSSSDDALRDIQARVHRFDWFKAYTVMTGGIALMLLASSGRAAFIWFVAATVPGYFLHKWNRERRTARLIYDVDDQELLYRLSVCNAAGEAFSNPRRLWHIYSSLATSDWKRNAGASDLIRRTNTACRPGSLRGIELNIEPWSIAVGPQQLLFLPDRVLIHERNRFAAISYENLVTQYELTRFIEEEAVPSDARQVDTTWQFVKKSGGPDRRFNNNRQLPVMEYGRLTLTSPHGLTVILESSDPSAVLRAHQALAHLREVAVRPCRDEPLEAADKSERGRTVSSGVVPTAEVAHDLTVVLRYIAVADRKISESEVEFVAPTLLGLGTPSARVQAIMSDFRSIRSGDAEALRAVQSLARNAPAIAGKVPQLIEMLAAADGRTTPKERERLAVVSSWLEADLQNSA